MNHGSGTCIILIFTRDFFFKKTVHMREDTICSFQGVKTEAGRVKFHIQYIPVSHLIFSAGVISGWMDEIYQRCLVTSLFRSLQPARDDCENTPKGTLFAQDHGCRAHASVGNSSFRVVPQPDLGLMSPVLCENRPTSRVTEILLLFDIIPKSSKINGMVRRQRHGTPRISHELQCIVL